MKRSWLAGSALLGILAVVLFLVALFVPFPEGSHTTTTGTAWSITPASGASSQVTVQWSGGVSSTQAYLTRSPPDCASISGVLASGSGASGSFTALLDAGTTYWLVACDGRAWQPVTFTLVAVGATAYAQPLEVGGAFAACGCVVLLFLGLKPGSFGRSALVSPRRGRR